MRTLARQLVQPIRARGNQPLGAAMMTHSGGVGLTTEQLQRWLATLGQQPARGAHLEQYARSVPVYFAVKLRADAVAKAPLRAYRTTPRGELEWVGPNHRVQRHLDAVNPWWSRGDLWRAVETYLCLWGSSFRWVNKPTSDPSTWEQWVLRPDKVVVVKDRERYIRGFVYDPQGARFPMEPDEVLWDRYFNPLDEFSGQSPLEPLRELLTMRQDMIRTNARLFRNGVLAQNLAFLMNGPLQSEQVDAFYQRLEERHGGPDRANRPIVVDLGVGKVETLGFSNREMEWMDGLKWTAGDMLTALGVREELYPGSQRTTFHNLGEAHRAFYRDTVSSEWSLIEDGMQERFRPMLSPADQGLTFKFDTTVVAGMQESIDSRSQRLLNEVRFGTRTPDEYRADFGMPPLPEGMGAKPYVPSGTTPLAMIGEEAHPQASGQGDAPETPRMVEEVRCPGCRKLLGQRVAAGTPMRCRRCKAEFTAEAAQ